MKKLKDLCIQSQDLVDYSHAYTTKGARQSIAMLARNYALKLVADLHGYEVEVQQQVIEKMFRHDLVKPMLPSFLSNIGESKHIHLIVESIKNGVFMHLANGHTTKHTIAREFIGTLASTRHASGIIVAK